MYNTDRLLRNEKSQHRLTDTGQLPRTCPWDLTLRCIQNEGLWSCTSHKWNASILQRKLHCLLSNVFVDLTHENWKRCVWVLIPVSNQASPDYWIILVLSKKRSITTLHEFDMVYLWKIRRIRLWPRFPIWRRRFLSSMVLIMACDLFRINIDFLAVNCWQLGPSNKLQWNLKWNI